MGDDLDKSVVEPQDIGDLSDVKEQRTLIPPTKNVKLMIKRCSVTGNKEGTYKSLAIGFQLVDGINISDEIKYKGSMVSTFVTYYANPEVYTKDYFKNKQHLVQLKYLLEALGMPEVRTIDIDVVNSIADSGTLLADITQKKGRDGELENEIKNFKVIPITEEV